MSCGSAGQHSQTAAGRAQQSSVRALSHACRRSSGAERVLDVRIDWNVKSQRAIKVKRRAVQSQAGVGQGDNSRSSARSCSCRGALEQWARATWSYCLGLRAPWGSALRVREMWRHRAQQRSTPVKREAAVAGLASEGLALVVGSAGAGSSAVVGPTPTDPVEFRKCARDLKTLSAAKKITPMKSEAAVAILASEGLAQVAVSCQHAQDLSFAKICLFVFILAKTRCLDLTTNNLLTRTHS